jgi:hypothetical protein
MPDLEHERIMTNALARAANPTRADWTQAPEGFIPALERVLTIDDGRGAEPRALGGLLAPSTDRLHHLRDNPSGAKLVFDSTADL